MQAPDPSTRRFHREDVALLLLRVTLGVLILFHGFAKIRFPEARAFIVESLAAVSLPTILHLGVYLGELVAPALLIAGIFSRPAAAVIGVNMLFALGLAHTGELFSLNEAGGWAIELQVIFLVTAVALALLGPGRFSVSRGRSPFG